MSTTFRLLVPRPIFDGMIAQARRELPNECCGLLAGTIRDGAGLVSQCYSLVNDAASPVEFVSDGKSMFMAERARAAAGLEFLAVYHSHPTSDPVPSRTDLERNYSEDVMNLIISLKDDVPLVKGWWLSAADYRPAEWQIA